jgi:nucleolar MIF4G domain-containing protein 1
VNECIWNNTKNACVAPHMLMSGLIPVYMAALTGVHYLKGDSAQLGEYLTEQCVADLWKRRQAVSDSTDDGASSDPSSEKTTSNLVLMLCYLYNFGVIHCLLLYDLIREFIIDFSENDIELLLLILSHSGRSLRTDDPTALKDIVLLVQKRALEVKGTFENYSRVDYMVSAMSDLKNNKKRKQDEVFVQKTTKLRKMIGHIKSLAAKTTSSRTDSCLRISLADILNADTNGRWWKVGASWVGNQYQFSGGENESPTVDTAGKGALPALDPSNKEQARLLKLAAKYRMNTDVRRAIFCIIMGSLDCEDAFEKLVRAGMLKGRNERETVRVLMECCGHEKEFNKVYAYLAARIIEYQPQSKFSFQLAFWDTFKQFDDMKVRKAANYAKLLFQLVVVHNALKLNILKAVDMASPDELPEAAMIFVTLFFSSVLDHFEDPSGVSQLFHTGISHKQAKKEPSGDELDTMDEGEALRASLTIFFVRVLKSSPKYKKGSRFRTNLKAALKACDTDGIVDML